MADTLIREFGAPALAYALVAVATLPALALLRSKPNAPKPRLLRPTTFEVLAFTLYGFMLPSLLLPLLKTTPLDETAALIVAGILAAPLWLAPWVLWLRMQHVPLWSQRWASDVVAGIAGFLVITPVAFAVYGVAVLILTALGGAPELHPLTKLDTASNLGKAAVLLSACLVAPLYEESLFRGLMLSWARRRRWRPWGLFALAVTALVYRMGLDHLGAMVFLLDLVLLMAFAAFGREFWKKWPSRAAASIVATAAVFAVMHPWPTPYPLVVLGIGLGILKVRSGSVRPAMVAHALFNLVSVLVLLSGAAK